MSQSIDAAKDALGQLFITGFSGLELSEETTAFITQAGIGGVILFAHNYENPGQVAELSNQIQECKKGGLPLWVSVDHEGAKVQRFKKGFTKIPEAAVIGATDSPKLVFELSEMMGKELKAVGVNLNFCPVADIATNPKNPVIGPRSYGDNEEIVSKMVTAMVRGHMVAGVQPCVKHFPGHGDTSTDSHFALPRVDTPLEVLREREFKPFTKAFKSRCSIVMTAHIIMSQFDTKLPATLSPKIVNEILRKELRYTRVVITDDMEMKAITDHYGAEDAPRLAIQAGCDMLCYRTEAAARHAYASLTKDLETGKLDPALVLAAAERITSLKKDSLLPYQPAAVMDLPDHVGTAENQAIVDKVVAAAAANGYPEK
ncbi:MAG: beta-N-acetylhexosaminidase [Oligoflexia bacterium]|nr:beta-N-acetylhexosaminidase [Oligoflexia bacterium]